MSCTFTQDGRPGSAAGSPNRLRKIGKLLGGRSASSDRTPDQHTLPSPPPRPLQPRSCPPSATTPIFPSIVLDISPDSPLQLSPDGLEDDKTVMGDKSPSTSNLKYHSQSSFLHHSASTSTTRGKPRDHAENTLLPNFPFMPLRSLLRNHSRSAKTSHKESANLFTSFGSLQRKSGRRRWRWKRRETSKHGKAQNQQKYDIKGPRRRSSWDLEPKTVPTLRTVFPSISADDLNLVASRESLVDLGDMDFYDKEPRKARVQSLGSNKAGRILGFRTHNAANKRSTLAEQMLNPPVPSSENLKAKLRRSPSVSTVSRLFGLSPLDGQSSSIPPVPPLPFHHSPAPLSPATITSPVSPVDDEALLKQQLQYRRQSINKLARTLGVFPHDFLNQYRPAGIPAMSSVLEGDNAVSPTVEPEAIEPAVFQPSMSMSASTTKPKRRSMSLTLTTSFTGSLSSFSRISLDFSEVGAWGEMREVWRVGSSAHSSNSPVTPITFRPPSPLHDADGVKQQTPEPTTVPLPEMVMANRGTPMRKKLKKLGGPPEYLSRSRPATPVHSKSNLRLARIATNQSAQSDPPLSPLVFEQPPAPKDKGGSEVFTRDEAAKAKNFMFTHPEYVDEYQQWKGQWRRRPENDEIDDLFL